MSTDLLICVELTQSSHSIAPSYDPTQRMVVDDWCMASSSGQSRNKSANVSNKLASFPQCQPGANGHVQFVQ